MITVLLIILLLAFFFGLPAWPYARPYGYYPSGIVGAVLVILVIVILLGLIPMR